MSTAVLLSALWSLLLLGAYLWQSRSMLFQARSMTHALVSVTGVALIARLVPHLLLPVGAGYDIESYALVADTLRRGADVYSDPATAQRHPYLPLLMYWMALSQAVADSAGLPFLQIVRLLPIAADVVIAACLVVLCRRTTTSLQHGLDGGLLYALNPIPVFVAAYHGQFDAVTALGMLLAIALAAYRPGASGLWLGVAILTKSWAVLIAPVLLAQIRRWSARSLFLLGMIAVPLLGAALYTGIVAADPAVVLQRALGYNWGVGIWGYTYIVRISAELWSGSSSLFLWLIDNGRHITLAALALVWTIHPRHESAAGGALTILVAYMALTHAFSIQYLMWLVPVALLAGERRWLARYTIAAFIYMFLVYTTFILEMHITRLMPLPAADLWIIIPASLPAWLVTVCWLASRLGARSPSALVEPRPVNPAAS